MKDYQTDYAQFLNDYKVGQMNGEQIGEQIVRFAQHYATHNQLLAASSEMLHRKAAEIIQSTTPDGKGIAANKAELLIKDTEEHRRYLESRTDLENVEQYINALKYLQKGVLNEYSHMSNT